MKSTLKRTLMSATVLSAFLLTGMPPASADEHEPEPVVTDFPAGQACEFALRLTSTGSKPLFREFTDKDGNVVRTLSVGNDVVLTYTNLDDPDNFITFKTAGSVSRTVFNKDGTQTVTATGHNGLILFDTDTGGPSTVQYTGKLVYTIDENGIFTVVSSSGRAVDVCAELSS